MEKAILKDKKVIPCDDASLWSKWFEGGERIIGQDLIKGVRVSTIFLGINHGFGKRPLWFETMIFGDEKHEDYRERYETWEEATAGHQKAIELVRGEKSE